jgi:hypothetical protein
MSMCGECDARKDAARPRARKPARSRGSDPGCGGRARRPGLDPRRGHSPRGRFVWGDHGSLYRPSGEPAGEHAPHRARPGTARPARGRSRTDPQRARPASASPDGAPSTPAGHPSRLEALELLRTKAQEGSVAAMVALERALRLGGKPAPVKAGPVALEELTADECARSGELDDHRRPGESATPAGVLALASEGELPLELDSFLPPCQREVELQAFCKHRAFAAMPLCSA